MDMLSALDIAVQVASSEDTQLVTSFLERAANGTFFHHPDFLAYHPEGRHRFQHLLFRAGDRLVAMVTGTLCAVHGGLEYRSCPAASFGGLVFGADVRLRTAEAVMGAWISHCARQGYVGIRVTLPPAAYNHRIGELTAFLAARAQFGLSNQQVSFLIPLDAKRPDAFEARFRSASASQVRGARRKGVTVRHGGLDLFDDFSTLFEKTYARHQTTPTHSADELLYLATAFPRHVTFYVADRGPDPLAALCVFRLRPDIAMTFYICVDFERRNENGVLAALAFAMDHLAANGCAWLDLGPSGDFHQLNMPVIDFKESTGAHYGLRSHWHLKLSNLEVN